MSSTAASTSLNTQSTSDHTDNRKDEYAQPHLGALEEDDEFEEFPTAGAIRVTVSCYSLILYLIFFSY